MKNNAGRQFRTKLAANICYSALISCVAMTFLVMNLSMIGDFVKDSGNKTSFFTVFARADAIIVLLYVIVGIAIFAVSFFILQEKSMGYISQISSAMQNIADGDLNTSVDIVGDDEFTAMAENLNRMVEEIRELMDKEREAERTKNELITNVAHDLRTPLTSIIGYLELLSNNIKLPDETRQKYIEITYTKAKRLQKLIEDLFGFTKMTYGKIAMHVAPVDIVKLLSQLLEEFYPNFSEKGISYELNSNVPAKVILADGNLLARVFDNLINNAIKYGADGKRVDVKVHAENEIVTVSVINYGYAIPKEDLPLIFDKFYRVEQSRSTGTGGTGLGLAIAKNIVDMHGGNIQVTSDLSGTVFIVKLKADFDINRENFVQLH